MTQLPPYALLHPDPDAAELHLTHNRDLVPIDWTAVWATVRASLADFAVRDQSTSRLRQRGSTAIGLQFTPSTE